jgi:AhpD family alkylhydroperoxidase
MKLDDRTIRLIAVGASITANCQPCLEVNVIKALENGADEQEIAEAIEVGKMVRQGAASKMDKFASRLKYARPIPATATGSGCDCDSFSNILKGDKNGQHTNNESQI